MNEEKCDDRAAVHFPPPFVFLGWMVVAFAVHRWLWPLPLPGSLPWWLPIGAGTLTLAAGFVAILLSFKLFKATGQEPEPWTTTPEIIITGIYTHSRNPMYLGMTLIQAGLGIALGNFWFVILVPPAMGMVYAIAIRHEETYLEKKFGKSYVDYKQAVRRWL